MRYFDKNKLDSTEPSDIVKRLIYENGGIVTIPLFDGRPCKIIAENDGTHFSSDKLGQARYDYRCFNIIVEHLRTCPGFRAPKGTARNKADKVGYGKCTEGTVIYNFATKYAGKSIGTSTFDPIFVLAAVLDWAGIAENGRGYLALKPPFC